MKEARSLRVFVVGVALGTTVVGCSWLEPSPAGSSPAEKTPEAVVTVDDFGDLRAAIKPKGESLASALGLKARVEAARPEQLATHEPDYSFCRGTRCPPRTSKTVVYSNEPEIRLHGITTPGEGRVEQSNTTRADRRTLTATAFSLDGTLEAAAADLVAAFAKKNASANFRIVYWIPGNATPQDELKATQRAVELERALGKAGVPKARLAMRSEKGDPTDGRVVEVTATESGS